MHYLPVLWDILDLLGSIATTLVFAGLLLGKLELRRTRPAPEPQQRVVVVHESVSAEGTAAEVARIQTLSGREVF